MSTTVITTGGGTLEADLDHRIGLENFPDPPDLTFMEVGSNLQIVFQAQSYGFTSVLSHLSKNLRGMAKAIAGSQIQKQSDYVLWPPVLEEGARSDKPVKSKHPVYHNQPDFKRREAIRNLRSKRLSRPIGSPGCGVVWNRGRFSP